MSEPHTHNSGFLLIDKPATWTSHDVVHYVRKIVKQCVPDIKRPKVGHAGTLDPFATGLLILGIRKYATKRIDEFKSMPKEYIATLQLGYTSDTYDSTGEICKTAHAATKNLTKAQIEAVLKQFMGPQSQLAPMHSAKKVQGKRLYKLARKGIEVDREPHAIDIINISLIAFNTETLTIAVTCSPGTYIRTLAHDIGHALSVGAYCSELRRTKIGPYDVVNAHNPKDITRDTLFSHLFNI